MSKNTSNRDKKFFELARQAAEKSDFPQKMGCVVVYKNQVISEGYNQKRTHPMQIKYDAYRPEIIEGVRNVHSMHAESSALFKIMDMDICWRKAEIYVYRIMKCKPFGLAKPCPSCTALIRDLGIKKVHYTSNDNSYITEEWIWLLHTLLRSVTIFQKTRDRSFFYWFFHIYVL